MTVSLIEREIERRRRSQEIIMSNTSIIQTRILSSTKSTFSVWRQCIYNKSKWMAIGDYDEQQGESHYRYQVEDVPSRLWGAPGTNHSCDNIFRNWLRSACEYALKGFMYSECWNTKAQGVVLLDSVESTTSTRTKCWLPRAVVLPPWYYFLFFVFCSI